MANDLIQFFRLGIRLYIRALVWLFWFVLLSAVCLFFVSPKRAHADDWLCRTQASEQRGSSYLACGMATEASEDGARIQALENAKKEIQAICPACEISRVEPKRTECIAAASGFTCYRLIVFTPGATHSNSPVELEQFGEPIQISAVYFRPQAKDYLFHGEMCFANDYCHAIVENGKITALDRFKPRYMK